MADARPASARLSRTALGAALAALAAAWTAGALAGGWALAAAAVLVSARTVALRAATPDAERRLHALGTAATCAGAVLVLVVVGTRGAPLRLDLLAPLLAVVLAPQPLTWRTPTDVRPALLCVTGLLIAASATAPDVLVAPPLLAGWVLLLVAALHVLPARLELDPEVRRPVPVGAPRGAALVLPVALTVGAALLAWSVVPTPGTGPGVQLARASSGSVGAALDATTSPRLDLRDRIDVGAGSTRPVLEVPADSPPLWRSTVYGDYDGVTWSAAVDGVLGIPGPPPFAVTASGSDRVDDVEVLAPSSAVWAPGEVQVVHGDARSLHVYGQSLRFDGPVRRYDVGYTAPETSDQRLAAAGGPAPEDGRWLALPAGLPQRVRDLSARLTAGAATQHDAVTAVRDWLRGSYQYRLDVPVPAPGEDAVDRFLFVDRAGFCQQFASAHAVLLRAAGIPARVVSGVGYGVESGARRVYEARHLHAWVEVHYAGIGWVPSDATAAGDLTGSQASLRDRVASDVASAVRRAEQSTGGRAGLVAIALLLVAGACWAAARLAARRPRASAPAGPVVPPSGPGPALAAFLRFDGRLGRRRRAGPESLREMGDRLAPPPEVARALAVVEQECYAPQRPADAARAAAVLDAVDVDALVPATPGVQTVVPRRAR